MINNESIVKISELSSMVTYHAVIIICIFFEYFLKYPQHGVVIKWRKMENEMVKFIGGGMGVNEQNTVRLSRSKDI